MSKIYFPANYPVRHLTKRTREWLYRREVFESYLRNLHKPFDGYRGKPDWKPKDIYPSLNPKEVPALKPMYLRKVKLPPMSDEDKQHYARVLRMLRSTLNTFEDKTASPQERTKRISYLLASIEFVRPAIQATWRKDFIALIATYRLIREKYWEQESK